MAPKTTKASKTETDNLKQPSQTDKNGDISIKVLAKPGSKENSIVSYTQEGLEIKVTVT